MIPLDQQQARARAWFESLRDRICAAFEAIEREAGSSAPLRLYRRGSAKTCPAPAAAGCRA